MTLTEHAVMRMQQRGIRRDELELAIRFGRQVHNGGALFIFMGARDIPGSLAPARKDRLEGLTLVVNPETEEILTTYKNRGGLRMIKRKRKEYRPRIAA